MERTLGSRLTDEQIETLEKAGFRRWTKYGKDRLYASPAAIGLELDYYKSGNISYATLNGEQTSNSYARKLLSYIDGLYIDVETSKITGSPRGIEILEERLSAM